MFWPLNYHHQSKGKLDRSFMRNSDTYWHTFSLRKNVMNKSTQEKHQDILNITPEIPESDKQEILETKFSALLSKIIDFEENLETQKQELAKEEETELNDIRNCAFMNMGRDYFTTEDIVASMVSLGFDDQICTPEIAKILLIRFSSLKDKRDFDPKFTEKSTEYLMNSEEFAHMFLPQSESIQDMVLQRVSKISDIKDEDHMEEEEKQLFTSIRMSIGAYLSWVVDELVAIKELVDEFTHYCSENEADIYNFINGTFDIGILKSETFISVQSLVDFVEDSKGKIAKSTQPKDVNHFKAMNCIDSFFKLQSWDPQINSYYAKVGQFIEVILAYSEASL